MPVFTAPERERTLEITSLRCWRADCGAVILAYDFQSGSSLNAFKSPWEENKSSKQPPDKGKSLPRRERSGSVWSFLHKPSGSLPTCPWKIKPVFSFYFANITAGSLAKGKRTEPLFSSVEVALFIFLFLSINHTLHKNENYSTTTHKNKNSRNQAPIPSATTSMRCLEISLTSY